MLMNYLSASGGRPDFAYPQKVEKDAEADLRNAMEAGDGKGAVGAMVRIALAKSQVNTDSLSTVIGRVADLTTKVDDPVAKAMLNALSAKIYTEIYSSQSWIYDRRPSSAIAGDDYNLWSREQFLEKVVALTDASLSDKTVLQGAQVTDYAGIVEIESADVKFYPTLFDFISVVGIRNLDRFASSRNLNVLNTALLENPGDARLYPASTCSPLPEILAIYSGLMDFHRANPAPLYAEEIAVRKFIRNHLFSLVSPRGYRGRRDGGDGIFTREMLSLYEYNKGDEFAGLFLLEAADNYAAGEDAAGIYPLLEDYSRRFPGGFLSNDIDNRLNSLSRPEASMVMSETVAPGREVSVGIESLNGRSVVFELFNVTGKTGVGPGDSWVNRVALGQPLERKTLEFNKQIPFTAKDTVKISFPSYGLYVARLTVDGKVGQGGYHAIRCSDLSLSATFVGTTQTAWVVNPADGSPVDGVSLSFAPWSRRKPATLLKGTTDADGMARFSVSEAGNLSAIKGDDRYSKGIYVYEPGDRDNMERSRVEIYTSLGLYRPGDEVEFALVAYSEDDNGRRISADRDVQVEVMDANNQPVDTVKVVTDSWGRATGKFSIPTAGLTGSYRLSAILLDGMARHYAGGRSFEVSDYKLPTFELNTTSINRPATVSDGASVEGTATTYSGFPVADAQVKASLTVQQGYWWWRSESPVFFTTETKTDAQGKFTVEIPASVIASSPAPGGIYRCLIEVTSADGETRQLTATFNMGKPLGIIASVPAEINLAKPFAATVEARDANGGQQPLELNYKVTGDTVLSGHVMTGSVVDIVRNLPTGSYSMTFSPSDTLKADKSAPVNFVVYRPDDSVCPVDQPLWVPSAENFGEPGGKGRIVVGSCCGDVWVRMIVVKAPGEIVEQRWLRLRKGMQTVEVKFPKDAEVLSVDLSAVRNFKSYSGNTTVKSGKTKNGIKVELETFRDRVLPGSEEKVTLRVKPVGETTAQSAVFLDMSNKAIDVLVSNPLTLTSFSGYYVRIGSNGWDFGDFASSVSKDFKYKDGFSLSEPAFQLYGLSFTGGGVRRLMRTRGYGQAMKSAAVQYDMAVCKEEAEDCLEVMNSAADFTGAVAGVAVQDAAAVETVEEEAVAADGGTANGGGADDGNYRPSEIPLAFFRPMLTTDDDGSLEISYTVPDANTTWLLRAMAYNKELLSSSTQAEIVASKPVMVSQNAPRFLRTADKVTLASSVMNNTDSARTVIVKSEILSASTGKILTSGEETFELPAMGSAVASVNVESPVGETGLIYRVKAKAGDYTDGEQSLLPVLPSEQDVVESTMFYIAPDEASFTLDLPAMEGTDRAYLNFTENPSWQVVSALPGLREGKINSSVEASAALFSAAVAAGIMRDNPEIARVLRRWLENPGDSALVSALQKNGEIKSMLLNSTPWVSEALSDTERMQRLALLFDKRQTGKVISEAIDRLAQTRAEGGWAWTDSYPKVSRWCTDIIMEELGDLNRMGWLPSDARLKKMIKESCEYLDRETVQEFRKYPKADYWHYVIIRDRFPEFKPSTAASRVIEAEVQKALAQWRNSSVAMKGVYAMLLNSHGYTATARQILGSLREFATSSPEKGMWWQQLDRYTTLWSYDRVGITSIILDAFHAVEPDCADVERIRQWLILNKTNNDWGTAVVTTQTIASILTSGKPLKMNTRGTAIHIGDTLLEPQSEEYATGAFTEQITSMLAKPATMTVDRQADYPSVGGVVMMRRLPMDSVGAIGCQEVTVEKSLTVFDGSQWVAASDFKVGDKVRVELTLRVEDDLSYVVIEDLRAAGLEPVGQLSTPILSEGLYFYRENRDSQTNIFIDFLPRGTYRLAYELYASQAGSFASGVAQVQSQYNPVVAAHSSGMTVNISK